MMRKDFDINIIQVKKIMQYDEMCLAFAKSDNDDTGQIYGQSTTSSAVCCIVFGVYLVSKG